MVRSSDGGCEFTGSAADFVPEGRTVSLLELKQAAAGCRGCELYCRATQVVFGEGRRSAKVVLVGEQPGDQEDLAGKPFVGPAGRVLDEGLAMAGIDRKICYVTNAVKHFKFERRGKRRIHKKPGMGEVKACKPWLVAELLTVRPEGVVCLGATACQSLLGKEFKLTEHRGEVRELVVDSWSGWVLATVHPSSLLRMPEEAGRRAAKRAFVEDLKTVAKLLTAPGAVVRH